MVRAGARLGWCLVGAGLVAGAALADAQVRDPGYRFEIDVSHAANLFHWIDNLAGTSGGKTVAAYRRQWIRRVGRLTAADHEALVAFRRARMWNPPPPEALPPGNPGCVPFREPHLAVRQRVTAAALAARSLTDLERRLRGILPPEQAGAMVDALRHFRPAFDERIWPRSRYLFPFARSLQRFLARERTSALVRRFADYLGADLSGNAGARLGLVALLEDGPTHAEADGSDLLIEIRPGDVASDQTQVVFHELAHDLFRRIPPDRRERLAREFFARGRHGATAWKLVREGLPTALGQGVAQRRLAPWDFRFEASWYHVRAVDLFAHAIYRTVRETLDHGGTVEERLPDAAVRWVSRSPFRHLPPAAALDAVLVASRRDDVPAVAPFAARIEALGKWRVAYDEEEGRRILARYACAPLVLFLRERDLTAHRPLLETLLRGGPPRAPGSGGPELVPGRRPSGAAALTVVLPDGADARKAALALAALSNWPEEPRSLNPPPDPDEVGR
ncbi:MAG: hypothetical protein D6718_10195 [Acidobacteria bacterium]|nr:MAG: hypothetical protein D6718_10195 [Acidobacteriota bacterium]